MFDFPELLEIPLAKWVDGIMDWLLTNLDGFFDAIGFVILQVVLGEGCTCTTPTHSHCIVQYCH